MTFLAHATAYAPGSIGNFGPGLDVLGCAVEGLGDEVTAEWHDVPGVTVIDPGHPDLPAATERHASGIAALAVVRRATSLGTTTPARGIALRVRKGLPLAAGQGGSAASAVAGAAAVNALIGEPLTRLELMAAALSAEAQLAGRHLDNIAPSLLGGIVVVRSMDPIDVASVPVPERLRLVLVCPSQRLRTAEARAVLPEQVPLETVIHQMAQVAAIVAACHAGDLDLLGRALDDRLAESVRAPLLPGFRRAKQAALDAGALGVSISGAGPTAFAVCDGDAPTASVAGAMREAYEADGLAASARVARPDLAGTRVETAQSRQTKRSS